MIPPMKKASSAQKAVAWIAPAVAAILALALASRCGDQADLVRTIAWSLLAAVGLSLLARRLGRRLVALVVLLLGAGLAMAVVRGQAHAALLGASALAAMGGLTQLVFAPRWATRDARFDRTTVGGPPQTDLDVWKAFDAGLDPTADHEQHTKPIRSGNDGSLAPREH
ncbi:hypothetical protein GCM10027030_31580 [Luteococcus sediminum]